MRDIFKGYKMFDIDARKSRSRDFYKMLLADRAHTMKKFAACNKKPAAFVCLLCGSKRKKEYIRSGDYRAYECLTCGLVSPNIDMTIAGGHEVYDNPENIRRTTREIIDTYEYRKMKLAPERLAYLLEKTGLKKKDLVLLDVGCGPGYFLSYLKDKRVRSKGLELTAFLVEVCLKQGLLVAATELSAEKPHSYTALTLFDVLEHLTDPISFFIDANRSLKKGGYILAYAPHIHSFAYMLMGERQNTLYPFQHVGFYDPVSAAYLAKKTGFKIHTIEYFGLDVLDYFCMKSYDDGYDYLTKLHEAIPLLQAVIDRQNISNHMRIIFKKISDV